MEIVGDQLDAIAVMAEGEALAPANAMALSGYLRALSAVKRDRSPAKGGAGRLAGKSVAELLELARQDPELAEALGAIGA